MADFDKKNFDETFWKLFEFIGSVDSKVLVKSVLEEFSIDRAKLNDVIKVYNDIGHSIKFEEIESKEYLIVVSVPSKEAIEITRSDLFMLQAGIIKNSLGLIVDVCKRNFVPAFFDLAFKNNWIDLMGVRSYDMIETSIERKFEILDNAIKNNSFVHVQGEQLKTEVKVFPYRIVYLDSHYALVAEVVGETVGEKHLVYFHIEDHVFKTDEIDQIKENNYQANHSQMEIQDFISAVRAVSGNEERLVLKIIGNAQLKSFPDHNFLGNPYVTLNSGGDKIWAGTVEMNEDVYEWLLNIRDRIEIIDPNSIKKGLLEYCSKKLEKQGKKMKKAS